MGKIVESPGSKAFPSLDALIGGYFHQDFDINGNSLEEIIASFKWTTTPDIWQEIRDEIEKFIGERQDDNVIAEDFERTFSPGVLVEGWDTNITTWRHWLVRIAELLRPTPSGVAPAQPPHNRIE